MQNALGVSQQDCQNLRYEDNNLVLEIQTPKEKLCCPVCGSHNINRNGSHIRRFVSEHLPNAALVVDHFHVTKLMNEKLDLLRRQLWHEEKDINKRKVIKGTRWLLLKNGNDIFDYAHRNRLENALSLNRPLMIAYYLKEDLKEIWNQCSKQKAKALLDEWVKQAIESKIQPLVKMALTIRAYKTYILAWYDHCITNGTIEGINNKIKVLKRQIYGFRNEEYFTLRLYALHDRRLRI